MKQVPTCEYFPFEAVADQHRRAPRTSSAPSRHSAAPAHRGRRLDRQGLQAGQRDGHDQGDPGADLHRGQPRQRRTAGSSASATATCSPRAARSSRCSSDQIRAGGPVTITDPEMTRFLLSLDGASTRSSTPYREARPRRDLRPEGSRRADRRRRRGADRRPRHRAWWSPASGRARRCTRSSSPRRRRTATVERGDYYALQPMLPELRHRSRPAPARAASTPRRDAVVIGGDELEALIAIGAFVDVAVEGAVAPAGEPPR